MKYKHLIKTTELIDYNTYWHFHFTNENYGAFSVEPIDNYSFIVMSDFIPEGIIGHTVTITEIE